MSGLEVFILCWVIGIVSFAAGCIYVGIFRCESDAQNRLMRHVRESDNVGSETGVENE